MFSKIDFLPYIFEMIFLKIYILYYRYCASFMLHLNNKESFILSPNTEAAL